jgi:hypothetical protein
MCLRFNATPRYQGLDAVNCLPPIPSTDRQQAPGPLGPGA